MTRILAALTLCLVAALAWADSTGPRELDWLELLPEDEVQTLMDAPPVDHSGQFKMEQQGSFRAIAELDGQLVKLPGYIVPLDIDDDQQMSAFFLVPYFGACIHVPPPPPNQIILVTLDQPIPVTDIYDAFWIEGTIRVATNRREIADSAYHLDADKVTLY